MFTDLFGFPLVFPETRAKPTTRRQVSEETKRARLLKKLEQSSNLVLFDELLDFLKAPLLKNSLPIEYASDVGAVDVFEVEDEAEENVSVSIPFEAWGEAWVTDSKGLDWSKEGLLFTQVRLFWRSLEELSLSNNEQEKWSVLRWIFRPAVWKDYVWDARIGRSHCVSTHERDEPFSFHNCCIAARMDRDLVREGVCRNIPAEIIKAVERVCSFN